MKQGINMIFEVLAVAFNKVPLMGKISGYRTVIGLVGLAVTIVLKMNGVIPTDIASYLELGFTSWSALALNAKGRPLQ